MGWGKSDGMGRGSLTVWGGGSLMVWGRGNLTIWGGGSLTVWGGFTFNHRTQFHVFRRVIAAMYQNDVINNHIVPFFGAHPRVRLLQQDKAGLTRPGQHRCNGL